jgi:hypothetical protein
MSSINSSAKNYKEVYGQLLLLDFNQPELQPFTAYGQACFIVVIGGGLGIGYWD